MARRNKALDSSNPEAAGTSWRAQGDYQVSAPVELASRTGVGIFSLAVFLVAFAIVCGIWWLLTGLDGGQDAARGAVEGRLGIATLIVATVLALLALSAVHVAQQWEKVVVLRLGRFARVAGSGPFLTIPLIESCTLRVDMRVRTTSFGAEETLTSDLVPLNVDAVLFWHVWDARLACMEVGNFALAVELAAQTALRDAIGRASVVEVAIRRQQLDRELRAILEEKVAPWGISILSVEVRDILVPKELQDVMSAEAQAEQRKKARIILMEAEADISEMLAEMGDTYASHDQALKLRMMHLLYESVRDTGGTVVIPSDFSEAFREISPSDIDKLLK
ncbi:MAG: slipin family protein [Coriobacteriales bacterium]|jgi:regulator of protease activity HflC (stomatin/prohibitin superfamily)|nr:slipin family protein [Coriobacteriales bacterium]